MNVTIALSYEDAALAVGLKSVKIIRQAVKDGDLIATFLNSKPVIGAKELERWFDTLPHEAPKTKGTNT